MVPISDNIRLILWIITGVAAALLTALYVYLDGNIRYGLRRLFANSEGGRKPAKRPLFIWFVFGISIIVSIVGAAWASSAPAASDQVSNSAPSISVGGNVNGPIIQGSGNTVIINPTLASSSPIPSPFPSATATPISLPMNLLDKKIIDTGLKGQICGYSKVHSIVRDLQGNLHIFFVTTNEPTTVFESISTDNGQTWSHADNIAGFVVNGQSHGLTCAAALDPLGNIHLFFDLTASDIGYTSWSPSSGWSRPVIRGQGLPDVGNYAVNLATGPGNQVHAVWSSKKLWYTFFDGKGWSSELEVAPGGWHPDIFVDNNDVRHVVYNDANFIPDKSGDGSSFVTVNYTFSSDGTHWSDSKVVPPDDGKWKGDATIKVDSTGRRHITYIEWAQLEGDLYYTYSDDGEAWSQPEKINIDPGVVTGNDGNESAAMLLDQNDNLYVVWQAIVPTDWTKSRLMLRWLNKKTQQWSDPIEITKIAGGIGDQPSMLYQVYGLKDKNNFTLDMVWTSGGAIYYGQVNFKAVP